MKKYIPIACLALCGLITYLLWPTDNSAPERATPAVAPAKPETEQRLEPAAVKPEVVWNPIAEATPAPSVAEDQAAPEPELIKANHAEEDEPFVERQEPQDTLFNEFVDLIEEIRKMPPSENDDERELRDAAILSAGRLLADAMIESGTPLISQRGWNFFVDSNGNFDYGLSEL